MNKILSIIILLSLAITVNGIPGPGGGIGDPVAPSAPTMTATKPSPFVSSNDITLSSNNGTLIFYDLNNLLGFDNATAVKYMDVPIHIVESTTLRALACDLVLNQCSSIATWVFTKNLAPTLTLVAPGNGQIIRQRALTPLRVKDAIDAYGSVVEVHYFRKASGTTVLEEMGSSTIGPAFSVDWTSTAPGTGPYIIHALAKDNLGDSGTSQEVTVNITLPNQTPTVSLSSPLASASFMSPATITLTAIAKDPDTVGGGITKVDFYQGTTLLGSSASPPYSYTWTGATVGAYDLSAKAYDNNTPTAIGTSAIVNVTVLAPNILPSVVITNPVNGQFYNAPASDSIRVTAIDSDGSISKVEFYNGAILEGTDFTAPFVFGKTGLLSGTYTFTAKAFDNLGAVSTSVPVTITVSVNQPPTVFAGNDTALTIPGPGTTVSATLKGVANDPENSAMTYSWTVPVGASITGSTTLSPTVTFSGTGSYELSLKVTDAGTPSASTTDMIIVTVKSKPVITSPITALGTALQAFSYTLIATGSPAPTLNITGALPTGLIWDPSTSAITGTPAGPGVFTVNLNATNSAGQDNKVLTLTVEAAPIKPAITSLTSVNGTASQAFSYTLTATGSPTPSLNTAGLPSWLLWNSTTGVLSGTPSAVGVFTVNLNAINSAGEDNKVLSISIGAAPIKPTITSPISASATALLHFLYTLTATGSPTPTLKPTGVVPSWLNWDPSTSFLTGTPQGPGVYTVNLNATNSAGQDDKVLTITVGAAPIKATITSPLSVNGKVGSLFTYTATASGSPSISFAITGLPPGLTFSGSSITGSPTLTGTFNSTLTATNSNGTDTKTLVITINADPKITMNLPDSQVILNKSKLVFSVSATGYPAVTYQWQYAGGSDLFGNIGINASSYTIDSASSSSGGMYRVIVKNGAGPNDTSKTCRLVIKPLPLPITIVTQPVPQTILVGSSTTFRVRATGDPTLLYQWFNGTTALSPTPTSKDSDLVATASGVYHASVTTLYTDLNKPSTYAVSDTARLIVQLPKLPKPTANPTTNSFSTPSITVVLSNAIDLTDIRYTLDGSTPNQTGAQPSLQFKPGDNLTLTGTTTVRAIAYKNGYRASDMMTEVYTYVAPGKVVKPTIRPVDPTFKASILCTLSTSDGSGIYFTTNGSNPALTPVNLYTQPFLVTSTTTVTAIAAKPNFVNSDTLMKTYTLEKVQSKAQAPVATPPGARFSSQQKVTLTSGTDSTSIYYTVDGTTPDTSSTRKLYNPLTGLTVAKTLTLKAISILSKDFLNSDIKSWDFKLVPLLSSSLPSGSEFNLEATIKLTVAPANAEIRYTVDETKPILLWDKFPIDGLPISSTTTISAVAVLDGVTSPITRFSYSLKGGQLAPPSPVTQGNTATFADSLKIFLFATDGAEIHYTVNGTLPTILSPIYQSPFWVDSTVTIEAIAIKKDFEHSKVMFASFTLIPNMPIITPIGGSYASTQRVTMSCSSKRAKLYYSLEPTDLTPENRIEYHPMDTIVIRTDTTLKAVAVAGNMASEVRTERYRIFGIKDTVLHPGDSYYLQGGYTISSPEDQSANVHIRLASADSLKLIGFDGIQYGISLTLAENQPFDPPPSFPGLIFTRSLSEKRSLYKVDPSGKIYFISGANTVTLAQPGIYFMGIDVSPPKITYLDEKILGNDSTSVSFSITDNVTNLVLDLKRSDDPLKNIRQLPLFSPAQFQVSLKNPLGVIKSLDIQIIASDYQLSSYLPSDSKYVLSLSQSFGAFRGPPKWKVGLNPKHRYDLISIPLALNPPISLSALANTVPNMSIQGAVWSNELGKYIPVDPKATFQPGSAFWVSSYTRLSSLVLPSAKTFPLGEAKFSVKIKHGWNQVGNPHLQKLFWPVSRANQDAYRSSPIKGLWGFNAEIGEYVESDSLEPWLGYFVYSYVTQDTTITLSNESMANGGLLKKFGELASEVSLSMGWGNRRTLKLGALRNASNGLGREDEFELPHENSMNYLKALRDGHNLSTDWIRFEQDELLTWTVAMGGIGDALPPLKILEQILPEGYETWAVSKARSMKFKLEAGQSISASGLAQDTLIIYSGPREQIQKLKGLQKMADLAPDLNLTVFSKPGGFQLQIGLPTRARLNASLWEIDGKKVGTFSMGPIAEGLYHFDFRSDFQGAGNGLKPGIYLLSLDVHGVGLNSRMTRKIVSN